MDLLPGLAFLLGGGGITALVAVLLRYRSENRRTYAEGGKLDAEASKVHVDADVSISDALQRRYDSFFDDLEKELVRMRNAEAECRKTLDVTRKELDGALTQIGKLRVEAANATADVKLARAEIVRLQDHLDVLEAKVTKRRPT